MMDNKTTHIGENVDRDYLRDVPNGRDVWAVLEQTPGLVLDRFDVGGSESGQQPRFSAVGTSSRQNQYSLNGVNTTDPEALGASSTYYAYDAIEEIQVSTSAHSAEVQSPGVHLNLVLESGGNPFRGGGALYFEPHQWHNLDDALRARGVAQSNRLDHYIDYNVELGGPIVRDRAWFYGHFSEQEIETYVIGFFLPNFEPGTDSTELKTYILRGSFQLQPRHRVEGLFFRNSKFKPNRDASRARPTPATALRQDSTTDIIQALYTGVLTPQVVLDGRFSAMDMTFPLGEKPDLPPDAYSRIDLSTGLRSGGPGQNRIYQRRRWQGSSSLSWFRDDLWGGSHDMKFGLEVSANPASTSDRLKGSILYRDVLGLPFQVELVSDPVTVRNTTRNLSIFAQDSITFERFVLNLGVRFDSWRWSYPEQIKQAGPWDFFFIQRRLPMVTPASTDVPSLNGLAPRIGLSYALTDDAKNLLKASYSRYRHQIGAELPSFANPNGRATALFAFNDHNGNGLVDDGDIDFDSPLAVNIPAANEVDSDIALPATDEFTFGFQHEMAPDLVVGAHLVYRKDRRLIDDVNVGVSFDQYEEVVALDPGLDLVPGTSDDRSITVYNQSPGSLGQDRFLLTNPNGLDASHVGLVLEGRKRLRERWQMLASLTLGESTGFLPGPGWESNEGSGLATPLFSNPNTLINAEGRTYWDRTYLFRLSGSYSDFYGFTLGGSFRAQRGQPLYRSISITAGIDGTPLNQGAIEVLADPQGFSRHPRVLLLDIRVERELSLGKIGRLAIIGDIFNMANANTVTEIAQRGRLFGVINTILPSRALRIGFRYRF
jgi:hypothetical protein